MGDAVSSHPYEYNLSKNAAHAWLLHHERNIVCAPVVDNIRHDYTASKTKAHLP